jgi:hypothetical protein
LRRFSAGANALSVLEQQRSHIAKQPQTPFVYLEMREVNAGVK